MSTATLILCRGPMDPSTFELTNVDLNATQIVVTLDFINGDICPRWEQGFTSDHIHSIIAHSTNTKKGKGKI